MTASLRAEFEAWVLTLRGFDAQDIKRDLPGRGEKYGPDVERYWACWQHARSLSAAEAKDAQDRLLSDERLEIGRKAIEDVLIEFRNSRIGQLRNNGLVIKEYDGTDSHIIRLGPEDALRIGIKAMLASASAGGSKG